MASVVVDIDGDTLRTSTTPGGHILVEVDTHHPHPEQRQHVALAFWPDDAIDLIVALKRELGRLPESPSPLRGERDDVGREAATDDGTCPYCGKPGGGMLCDDDHCRDEPGLRR